MLVVAVAGASQCLMDMSDSVSFLFFFPGLMLPAWVWIEQTSDHRGARSLQTQWDSGPGLQILTRRWSRRWSRRGRL